MKKIITIVILIILAGVGWKAYDKFKAEQEAQSAPKVETTEAVIRDIVENVKVTGEVTPLVSSEVKSEISGRIIKVYIESGQSVEKDQLLLELDKSELEAEAEAAKRSIESARLQAERSERDFKRNQELFEQGFINSKEFEDSKTDMQLAHNELEIQQARWQTIQEKIVKTVIRAPHAGIVINLGVTEGQVISGATSFSQGTVLMEIANLGTLLVQTDINEIDVARVYEGMEVEIRFDPIPDFSVKGKVVRISPSAQLKESVRVFPIDIIFTSDDKRIKPGMSSNVTITVDRAEGAVAVLVSGIFNEDGHKIVFLKKGADRYEKVPVTVGINNIDYAEVREGLKAGDIVALTRPPGFVKERSQDIKGNRWR